MVRITALILTVLVLGACSGDDESGGACMNGAMQSCLCADGVTTGAQQCTNGALGACLPCAPVTGGAGGMMTGGAGGMTGGAGGMMSGGAGGMTGGVGGMMTGGMSGGVGGMTGDAGDMTDDDAGIDDAGVDAGDAGGDAGAAEEGAQNGPCRESGDACDDGLDCYQPDQALPSFCTRMCGEDTDCTALSGATWTCWTMGGLCRVECDQDNDNADCPDGFECADVVGNFRCLPME